MKKILVLLVLLVACVPTQHNPYIAQNVLVIAHQGGEGLWPSDTMFAFEHATAMGVDMLDLDVHQTKDGELVVLHDATVNRTTGGTGTVKEMLLEDLRKLDAGYYWPQYSKETDAHPFRGQGIRIPTLHEVFAAFPTMPMGIEIKQDQPSIAKVFCESLRSHTMTSRVIVSSFKETAMREFREACPEVMTALTESEVRNILFLGDFAPPPPMARAAQVPVSAGPIRVVTRGFVEFATAHNIVVQPWTINEETEMRELIALGVHGLNTDRPDLAMKVLGR